MNQAKLHITRGMMLLCSIALSPAIAGPTAEEYTPEKFLGNLADKRVTECSGIVASRRTPGVYWVHNDSGDGPYLFATDASGKKLGRFTVRGAKANDWEDIAAAPETGEDAELWIGDIGDNGKSRTDCALYQVPEPAVDLQTGADGNTMLSRRYPFSYPDGKHDAETLLYHPKTNEIYIVTKEDDGVSGVYQFPKPMVRDRSTTLLKVATVVFTNPFKFGGRNVGKLCTAGDISPDGTRLVLRTYTDALEWSLKQGETIGESLARRPIRVPSPWVGQFEAICYSLDGKRILTSSEGSPCPLWETVRKGK